MSPKQEKSVKIHQKNLSDSLMALWVENDSKPKNL